MCSVLPFAFHRKSCQCSDVFEADFVRRQSIFSTEFISHGKVIFEETISPVFDQVSRVCNNVYGVTSYFKRIVRYKSGFGIYCTSQFFLSFRVGATHITRKSHRNKTTVQDSFTQVFDFPGHGIPLESIPCQLIIKDMFQRFTIMKSFKDKHVGFIGNNVTAEVSCKRKLKLLNLKTMQQLIIIRLNLGHICHCAKTKI